MKHFFSFRIDIDGPSPRICPFVSGPDHWKLSCHVLSSSGCLGLLEVTIKPLASRGGSCKCHCKPKDGSKNWESWIFLPYKRSQFCSPIEGREKCQQFVDFVPQWRPTKHLVICLGFTKGFLQIYIEKSRRWVGSTRIQKAGWFNFCFKMVDFLAQKNTKLSVPKLESNTKSRWHDPQDSGESEASGRPVQPKRVFI